MSRVENQMSLSPLGWRALMDRKAAMPGQHLIVIQWLHTQNKYVCTCQFFQFKKFILFSVVSFLTVRFNISVPHTLDDKRFIFVG